MTHILSPSSDWLLEAKMILEAWGLVAFPTETVYGLGANGLDPDAVKKIFIAKGRPQDNPLILHISKVEDFDRYARSIPDYARLLIDAFCPGPITFVFEKCDIVPDIVTAGLRTVCLRIPHHRATLDLLDMIESPLAWPSANRSGRPSPTSASHVLDDLDGRIDAVIDGGDTEIGIESTVVDCTWEKPLILREWAITREMLEEVLWCPLDQSILWSKKSPGTRYRHYAPSLPVILTSEQERSPLLDRIRSWENIAFLFFSHSQVDPRPNIYHYHSLEILSHDLFRVFRECEERGYDALYIERVPEVGIGRALMNRIEKAASAS